MEVGIKSFTLTTLRHAANHTALLLCLSACGGPQTFVGQSSALIRERTAAIEEGSQADADPKTGDAKPIDEDITAEKPIVISGAYLTCVQPEIKAEQSDVEVGCFAADFSPLFRGHFSKKSAASVFVTIDNETYAVSETKAVAQSIFFVLKVKRSKIAKLESSVKTFVATTTELEKLIEKKSSEFTQTTQKEEPTANKNNDKIEDEQILTLSPETKQSPTPAPEAAPEAAPKTAPNPMPDLPSASANETNPSLPPTPLSVSDDKMSLEPVYPDRPFLASINDFFERSSVPDSTWLIDPNSYQNGLTLFNNASVDYPNNSLLLYGNSKTFSTNSIRLVSNFSDLSAYNKGTIDFSYILLDIGDDIWGYLNTDETFKIKLCVKNTRADCGLDLLNPSIFNDSSIWIDIFKVQNSELRNGNRNCNSTDWKAASIELDFEALSSLYPSFNKGNVSVMIAAENFQSGKSGNSCYDAVKVDNFSLLGSIGSALAK